MIRHATRATTAIIAASVSIPLAGCAPGSDTSSRLPVWHLEERGRIGSEEDPGSALTLPIVLAVGDSVIYVVDGYRPRGTRFTKRGRRLGEFAHQGEGPGELRRASAVGITRDTVWIADPGGARLELYDPDGTFLNSIRFTVSPDSLGSAALPRALLADGSILAGPGGTRVSLVTSGRVDHATFLRTDRHGTTLSTVGRQPIARTDFFQAAYGEGRVIMGSPPLRQTALAKAFPDGSGLVVVERMAARQGDSASYTVTRYAADGTRTWKTDVPYTPVPAHGFLEAWLARRDSQYGPMPPAVARAYRNALEIPPYFPPASEVVAGKDGTVWVRREAVLADSAHWDVFDRRGRRTATLTASAHTEILAASAAEVWGVVTDAMDVPFLVCYAVQGGG